MNLDVHHKEPSIGGGTALGAQKGTSKRPRIGIYDPSARPSGPSRYVEGILSAIDDHEFEVVILGHPEGPHTTRGFEFVDCSGSLQTPLPTKNSNTATTAARTAPLSTSGHARFIPAALHLWTGFGKECVRLAARFRGRRLDLLHTNNTGCEESAIAARLARVPRVLGTFHVDSTYDLAGTHSRLRHRVLEYISNHCLDRAIAVSDATGRDWVRRTHLAKERIVVIPNGVVPERFQRSRDQRTARTLLGLPNEGVILIGGVGRLDEAKGFGDLIDALGLLASDYPDLAIAIAGDGPLRPVLEAKAAALGILHRVQFLGFQKDVRVVLESLDIFALPSLCEAMPYAILEAMAAGLPVVATTVGGVPEVVVPGDTGLVVPARDPHALATAIRSFLDSAERRQRAGQAGRDRVVHTFDERDTAKRTIQVYRDLIQNRR